MRSVLGLFAGLAAVFGAVQSRPPAAAAARVPVVVELFTSDGCSSCPPADALFSGLVQHQPIADADVIALGMHVDYWDQLGWKDPASLALATARQQAYGRIWGGDRVYTPQVVVDGRAEMIGSDQGAVSRAIARAATEPYAHVSELIGVDGRAVNATITVAGVPGSVHEPLDAVVFLTEDGLTSNVRFGENAGRTLHHDAVVRAMAPLGRVSPGTPLHAHIILQPEWHHDRMHVVALVQGHHSSRIWGATSSPIPGRRP